MTTEYKNGTYKCKSCCGTGGFVHMDDGEYDRYSKETQLKFVKEFNDKIESDMGHWKKHLSKFNKAEYVLTSNEHIVLNVPATFNEQAYMLEQFWNPSECGTCSGKGEVDWVTNCMGT